jgi:hypothetical protein
LLLKNKTMKKNTLFISAVLLFIGMVMFSCKKTATNALVGNWKLTAQNGTIITTNGSMRDTIITDSAIDPATSQILEFNGNNTYAVTDYSTSPPTVTYGKYSFSGAGIGTITITPDATAAVPTSVPFTRTYVIVPTSSFANSKLILISSTSGAGYTESDSTIYTFF